jgi:2'-5' RNA ligase
MYSDELDVFVKKQLLLHLGFHRQKELEKIVETIRHDLGQPETKFVPHLTLSRSGLSSKQQYFALRNEIEKTKIDLEFYVNKLYLFESILDVGPHPVYNKVAEIALLEDKP